MRSAIQKISVALTLYGLCAISAGADPLREEGEWLRTMAFAAHQTNYSGVFVYQSGEHVEMSRITHIFDKDGEHERLEGLDGQRREIIRNNDKVWVYLGDKKVRIERRHAQHSFPALLPEQIQNIRENYQIVQGEEDRVADYHAHTVVFQPKDNLRYARKMWAQSENGLLLKAVVLDKQGIVIEQYAFSQLSIGGDVNRKWIVPNESEAVLPAQHKDLPNLAKPGNESVQSGWQVDAMPSGFKKIHEMRRTISDKKFPVVHIVYSDGLAAISVFIERVSEVSDIHFGLASQGAVHIYSKSIGDNLVTVVGEVPPKTVIQVADSVRYAGE